MKLTNYIKEDLRTRILAGNGLPQSLSLAGLAAFYRVSPMPVRRAVAVLIDEDLLAKGEGGRLAVNPAKLGSGRAAGGGAAPSVGVAPPTDWAKQISDEVIRRSLRGESAHLKLEATATRLGIGRTLVHGIFQRLAGAGLLEHAPRRGWSIRPFRQADLGAYLDVREKLEVHALELARPHLVAADLRELIELNRPGAGARPRRLDNSLHQYWVARSQNRYIRDFFERNGPYFAALLDYAVIGEPLLSELMAQHREILEALLRHRLEQARRALSHDILRLGPILLDTIRRIEAGPAAGDTPGAAAATTGGGE